MQLVQGGKKTTVGSTEQEKDNNIYLGARLKNSFV